MKNKFISRCLNCGRDTGCPNKLVCDECRDKNIKKGSFYQNYVKKDFSNERIFVRDKIK